jgi:nicotinamide mononucleotide (NMN) deamidase PncC
MLKRAAPAIATTKAWLPIGGGNDTPAGLVCIALALALFVLALRIASVW